MISAIVFSCPLLKAEFVSLILGCLALQSVCLRFFADAFKEELYLILEMLPLLCWREDPPECSLEEGSFLTMALGPSKPDSAAVINLKKVNEYRQGNDWRRYFERKRANVAIIYLKANAACLIGLRRKQKNQNKTCFLVSLF